jgi:acyl carrier protein
MTTLTKPQVYGRLQDIFRSVFDDDSIELNSRTTSGDIAGWDSLNQIKIIIACENAFGIRLRPRELNALENVDEMVDHLLRAIARHNGQG